MDENRQGSQKNFRYHRSVRSGIGIGTISLLVIFTVLCFSTLALLSVSTAVSDQKIQQRSFDHTADLTQAQGRSAENIAVLDAQLYRMSQEEPGAEGYMESAKTQAKLLGWTVSEEGSQVTWTEPIDRNNNLVTILTLNPSGAGERYILNSQQQEYIGIWEPETGGQVMTQFP